MESRLLQMVGAAAISAVLGVIAVNFFYPGDLAYSVAAGLGSAAFAARWSAMGLL